MNKYQKAKKLQEDLIEIKSYLSKLMAARKSCGLSFDLSGTPSHSYSRFSFKIQMYGSDTRNLFMQAMKYEQEFVEKRITEMQDEFNKLTSE
jgi:hypothetical protein